MTTNEVISLREYIELKIVDLEKRLDERTELLVKQNDRDKEILNQRLGTMNEIRQQLNEQAATFATRELMEEKYNSNHARIEKMEKDGARRDGQIQMNRTIIAVMGAIALVVQLALEFLRHS